ncbi:MAG: DUF4405 domain-containing protein [Verrucomicrobiae bacterium]|nr:DUF4405 domain-containing protein [Verrucomicrobiae bacterium]
MALTFLALAISGVILFIAPPGRVANWTDWSIAGLTKHVWTGLHVWFATLFLVMTGVHLFYNWRPMMSYLKKRRGQTSGIRVEWLSSAVMAIVLFAGVTFALPPFINYIDWQESIKESWEEPTTRAPIPHAELLTVAELAEQAKIDSATALERLVAAGLAEVNADSVTGEVAEANGISAQAVYNILNPVIQQGGGRRGFSGEEGSNEDHQPGTSGVSGGGMGWKTLNEFCELEGIPVATALERLNAAGILATGTETLRDIAQKSGYDRPNVVLQVLRGESH